MRRKPWTRVYYGVQYAWLAANPRDKYITVRELGIPSSILKKQAPQRTTSTQQALTLPASPTSCLALRFLSFSVILGLNYLTRGHRIILALSSPHFIHYTYRGRLKSSPEILLEPDGGGGIAVDSGVITNTPLPRLPVEIIERVAEWLFELVPPTPEGIGDTPLYCAKPLWRTVEGFMAANVELHRMGFAHWVRTVTIKEPGDWNIISPHIKFIREIICLDYTLLDSHNQKILSRIPNLYSATIDAHSDVWHDANNRFAYRDIVAALPPSLKRLEVMHAHGPDVKVIATVKRHCPQIEVLRLGRCTMFNRIPACDFWASFPHDHDAYISDTGIDTYAASCIHSLGSELSPLKGLQSLRMGLYLVPSDTVLAHRLYHRRGRDAPHVIDWRTAIPLSELPFDPFIQEHNMDPATTDQLVSILHRHDSHSGEEFYCQQCAETTAEKNRRAEESASAILHEHIPSLVDMEWMNWLSPGHLGVHAIQFLPGV